MIVGSNTARRCISLVGTGTRRSLYQGRGRCEVMPHMVRQQQQCWLRLQVVICRHPDSSIRKLYRSNNCMRKDQYPPAVRIWCPRKCRGHLHRQAWVALPLLLPLPRRRPSKLTLDSEHLLHLLHRFHLPLHVRLWRLPPAPHPRLVRHRSHSHSHSRSRSRSRSRSGHLAVRRTLGLRCRREISGERRPG